MGGTLSREMYEKEVAVLEKYIHDLEEQLARFRQVESLWHERKAKLMREVKERINEIDFLYMLLLDQNPRAAQGSADLRMRTAYSAKPDAAGAGRHGARENASHGKQMQ